MSLSTFLSINIKRGEFDIIPTLETVLGVPVMLYDVTNPKERKVVNLTSSASFLPKDKEIKRFKAYSVFPKGNEIITFDLSAKRHIKTLDEKDNYAPGLDFAITTFIDLPYKGNEQCFEPFIKFAKLYGYSSYTISSEYDDEEPITASFGEPPYHRLISELKEYNKNKNALILYIVNELEEKEMGDEKWSKIYSAATDCFNKLLAERTAEMVQKNKEWNGHLFLPGEIEYLEYSNKIFETKMLCLAYYTYAATHRTKTWDAFLKTVAKEGYRKTSYEEKYVIPAIA